jgi:hypothetical protein
MILPVFRNILTLLLVGAFATGPQNLFAQCCSPGNPVAGASQVGILTPYTLRTVTYFRTSYSDTYYIKDSKTSRGGSFARYNYIGEILSFGLPLRFTTELELGYFLEKMQDSDPSNLHNKTYGLSNGVLSVKYGFLKSPKLYELTGGVGFKFPFTREPMTDSIGAFYPPEIQPSTGAFGVVGQLFFAKGFRPIQMKVMLINRYEYNGQNKEDYQFGSSLFSSVFISKTFFQHLVVMLQFRNEYRWKDKQYYQKEDGTDDFFYMTGTGGDIVFIAPQVSWSFPKGWSVSVNCDVPVYRYYNGEQLTPRAAGGISLIKDFRFRK